MLGGLRGFLTRGSSDGVPALFRLLNQNKYLDSQLFLLMTLGPTIALLPFAERARGWFASAPYVSTPDGQHWTLPLLDLVFAACVAALYVPCRWYAQIKSRGDRPWLRFV